MRYEIINKYTDEEGRYILLNVKLEDTVFSLICIYAPNCKTSRNAFFKKVSSFIQENWMGIPIVGGDFNDAFTQTGKCRIKLALFNNL